MNPSPSSGIVILGSSRTNGNTREALRSFDPLNTLPLVHLKELNITPYDYQHGNQGDAYWPLMEKALCYPTIILATPIYWHTMSAYMKIFIDRLSDFLFLKPEMKPKLLKKKVGVIASYSTSIPQGFEATFHQTCQYMGMTYQGCFFYYVGSDEKKRRHNTNMPLFRSVLGV